jgi:hypothetical protein
MNPFLLLVFLGTRKFFEKSADESNKFYSQAKDHGTGGKSPARTGFGLARGNCAVARGI